jgi:glycosyltransferase involved in cell wall biosynthesis
MGGGSARAHNVVKGLLAAGHKVTVIAGFPHYPHGNISKKLRSKAMVSRNRGNFRLIRVWLPPFPHVGLMKRLLLFASFMVSSLFPLLFVGDVQVVWVANPNFFAFFPGLVYGMVKQCPLVRNVDDLWPEVVYNLGWLKSASVRKLIEGITKITYTLPQALTPTSPSYTTHILEKYAVNPTKIHTIEVGVDLDIFHPEVVHKPDDASFTLMYSGILGPGYNFNIILDVAQKLSDSKDIHFIIRGVGEFAGAIKEQVKTLALKNVTVRTELLNQKKLVQMLRSADVFLLPLSNAADTGLPTKIFEYQALGKPIICCSNGPSAEYITKTNSGIVIRSQKPEDLKKAVLTLYHNPDLRKEMGLSGWNYVKNNLSYESIGRRMLNVFLSVISSSGERDEMER